MAEHPRLQDTCRPLSAGVAAVEYLSTRLLNSFRTNTPSSGAAAGAAGALPPRDPRLAGTRTFRWHWGKRVGLGVGWERGSKR